MLVIDISAKIAVKKISAVNVNQNSLYAVVSRNVKSLLFMLLQPIHWQSFHTFIAKDIAQMSTVTLYRLRVFVKMCNSS